MRYLILRLDGPMQAWGTHTFEDFRPSSLYPTRSALVGLLAACMGIDRKDSTALERLSSSITLDVRIDTEASRPMGTVNVRKHHVKMTDYHTVLNARRATRSPKDGETIQTRREYLCDAVFTVSIGLRPNSSIQMDSVEQALRKPVYTPTLGRRGCPISRPLLDCSVDATDGVDALRKIDANGSLAYSESVASSQPVRLRDVPIYGHRRKFGTRIVYLHKLKTESATCS